MTTSRIVHSYLCVNVQHCQVEPNDLFSLSLVCRSFHELAASLLYRNVRHVLPDNDDASRQHDIDRLAAVLETLTTSDYGYARFIQEISIDGGSATNPNKTSLMQAVKHDANYACGKFLNALLLATLKKVVTLETFRYIYLHGLLRLLLFYSLFYSCCRWNVRIEISDSVFAALSRLSSLQNLHVRLQAGSSADSTSTYNPTLAMAPPVTSNGNHHHVHVHSMTAWMPANSTSTSTNIKRPKNVGRFKSLGDGTGFARFSGLKSLAVLEIDDLEYIPEVARCICSSSSSLKTLKLSFSDSLALKARKKTAAAPSDSESQSDMDDGWADPLAPVPPPTGTDAVPLFGTTLTPIAIDADVRKERAAQEKALAQIFGLEESASQQVLDQALGKAIAAAGQDPQKLSKELHDLDLNPDGWFMKEVRQALRELLASGDIVPSGLVKALKAMGAAAAKYLEKVDKKRSLIEKKSSPFSNKQHTGKDTGSGENICPKNSIYDRKRRLLKSPILIVS